MKIYKFIFITFLIVIVSVGGVLAYNWWDETAPGTGGTLEGYLQGVADWAKGEQGLEMLGEYSFVTTSKVDTTQIKNIYAYQLSDGSIYGWLSYCEEQVELQEEWDYTVSGAGVDYARALLEKEAQYFKRDLFLGYYNPRGLFFAIGNNPETLVGYYVSCTEGCYYRG